MKDEERSTKSEVQSTKYKKERTMGIGFCSSYFVLRSSYFALFPLALTSRALRLEDHVRIYEPVNNFNRVNGFNQGKIRMFALFRPISSHDWSSRRGH
jgi:hypothetical protein